uniref:Uncharacterized protein n=1 Tax=Nelumbo nucifera TaxID=4432 RepID=A0A822ZGL5_NELNU|nr:TPA_asm: hypothetical protein HUJ06_001031 [Nelumbo nucifera]
MWFTIISWSTKHYLVLLLQLLLFDPLQLYASLEIWFSFFDISSAMWREREGGRHISLINSPERRKRNTIVNFIMMNIFAAQLCYIVGFIH